MKNIHYYKYLLHTIRLFLIKFEWHKHTKEEGALEKNMCSHNNTI